MASRTSRLTIGLDLLPFSNLPFWFLLRESEDRILPELDRRLQDLPASKISS